MTRYVWVALSAVGSAILLFSCSEEKSDASSSAEETMMTEYSENLSIINSQNGRRSYHFVTPLLEGYTLAREPYREFRKGIKITTYLDDSLSTVDAVLTANYAINYEKRELWEAKGNVVVEKSDGKTLYTQQLFWNARTGKIYSNVDSKIVQNNGRDVFIGEGFESDEEFKDWRFRRMKGRMEVEVKPQNDSVPADSAAVRPAPRAPEAERNRETSQPEDLRVKPQVRGARPAGRPVEAGGAGQSVRPESVVRPAAGVRGSDLQAAPAGAASRRGGKVASGAGGGEAEAPRRPDVPMLASPRDGAFSGASAGEDPAVVNPSESKN